MASPLGLRHTLTRSPLRRLAPFAWLVRCARSRDCSQSFTEFSRLFPARAKYARDVQSLITACQCLSSRRGFALLLSVLVLALFSNSAPAACCRVEGIVRSQAGIVVADATVSLSAPDLKAPMMTTTTAEGRYQFDDVKPGVWAQVRVLVNGRAVAEGVTLVTQPVETLNITVSP